MPEQVRIRLDVEALAACPLRDPQLDRPRPETPAAAPDGEAPLTEQFRQDLLDVVSTRTGYPTDALDETLQLESALGIDSIKTVEIFSNLKVYHQYFRAEGQEEEELLAEFSKFKTLRDIINAYDRRRPAGFYSKPQRGTRLHLV